MVGKCYSFLGSREQHERWGRLLGCSSFPFHPTEGVPPGESVEGRGKQWELLFPSEKGPTYGSRGELGDTLFPP